MSTPSPHRIPRTEVELRDALGRFCETAWHPGNPVPIFSIPPQPADADIILGDGIEELVQLRAENAQLHHRLSEIGRLLLPLVTVAQAYDGYTIGVVRSPER